MSRPKPLSGFPEYSPEARIIEQFVLDRLQEANSGPLDHGAVVRLFRRIMRESRRVEALAAQHPNGSSLASASNPTKLRGIA